MCTAIYLYNLFRIVRPKYTVLYPPLYNLYMVGKRGRFRRSYPEPVKRRFRAMQDDLPYKVTLVEVSGHYYVYKLVSELNDKTGRYRLRRGQCIGKVTDDGIYVPSKIRSELDIETAKAVILANGGKVTMPRERQQTFDYNGIQLTEQEERILTCLSMNARLTAPQIGKIVGMPAEHVASKVKHLESQLGIRYVADIDLSPLGYSQFLILVKFSETKPNSNIAKEELLKEPNIIFAAFVSGSYDLMVIVFAKSAGEARQITFNLNKLPSLRRLTAKWYTSPFAITYGGISLRQENFKLLENDIWHRTKGHPKPETNQLTRNEFVFLDKLNKNATSPLTEIERDAELPKGSGKYILDKLGKRGVLTKTTITMQNLGIKYNACILMDITNEELFSDTRASLLEYIIDERNGYITNRFSLVGDINVPRGGLLVMPVFQDDELETALDKLGDKISGVDTEAMIITRVIFGQQLYKRFDNTYSIQCERLATFYKNQKFINLLNKRTNYYPAMHSISL